MYRTNVLAALGFAGLFIGGCGYAEVAPPQAPAKEVPAGYEPRTTPPEPGTTRMVLEANGEKATVVEVIDATSTVGTASAGGTTATVRGYSETVKPVCIAPCVADLKPGMHFLRFASPDDKDRVSEAGIQVGDRSKVVRHAIGRTDSFSAGHFLSRMVVILGATAVITGGTLYGMAAAMNDDTGRDVKPTGVTVMAAGAGALLVGIPLMVLTRPVHQPGATTEMSLSK